MFAILTTQPLSFASTRSTKSLSRNTAGSSFVLGRDDPSAGSVTDGPLKLIELSLRICIFEREILVSRACLRVLVIA